MRLKRLARANSSSRDGSYVSITTLGAKLLATRLKPVNRKRARP